MSAPPEPTLGEGVQPGVPSNQAAPTGAGKESKPLPPVPDTRQHEKGVLAGINVPATGHIRAIPFWWWLVKPGTAFTALLAMKEEVSSKVSSGRKGEGLTRGSESQREGGGSAAGEKIKLEEGISLPMVGDIKWSEMIAYIIIWISNPLNMALTFWCILCIVPSIVIILVESGALDMAIPDQFIREEYVEISNQSLNALFVLMCLVWNPVFFRYSFQLYRWSPADIRQLREEYCRGGRRKPNEWWHMAVIFFWFHLTCVATYALAIVFWIWDRWNRPFWAVILTVVVSFGSPIAAFTYNILSPLGKDFYLETEEAELSEEASVPAPRASRTSSELFRESGTSFILSKKVVPYPTWQGRVLADCCQKPGLATITCCFPFCVFGLNSERLGFGQTWVQAASFILIVVGPCLVFEISAHTTRLYDFQRIMTYSGLCLAWLGLLYGAFWRYKMRKKFRLPPSRWCLGSGILTDAALWLFCCWCTLCQEVRTAEYYDIGADIFFEKSEEERRRIVRGESLRGVRLVDAGKRVAEGLKEGLGEAGRGVVRVLSQVSISSKRMTNAASAGVSSEEGDIESGGKQEAMAAPSAITMEGNEKGEDGSKANGSDSST